MANQRILASEEMVGFGHGVKADTLNRQMMVEHNEDGTHEGDKIIKGWINFNGGGVIAIQDHFNVSGIIDNGVGDYTVTWDTDFANVDYAVSLMSPSFYTRGIANIAVGSIDIYIWDDAGDLIDVSDIMMIAIGDQ